MTKVNHGTEDAAQCLGATPVQRPWVEVAREMSAHLGEMPNTRMLVKGASCSPLFSTPPSSVDLYDAFPHEQEVPPIQQIAELLSLPTPRECL